MADKQSDIFDVVQRMQTGLHDQVSAVKEDSKQLFLMQAKSLALSMMVLKYAEHIAAGYYTASTTDSDHPITSSAVMGEISRLVEQNQTMVNQLLSAQDVDALKGAMESQTTTLRDFEDRLRSLRQG